MWRGPHCLARELDGGSGDSAEELCGVGVTAWHASWTESAGIPRNRYVAWASLLGTREGWAGSATWTESAVIPRNRYVAWASLLGTRASWMGSAVIPRNRYVAWAS